MRKFSYRIIGKILSYIRYYNNNDPFKNFNKICQKKGLKNKSNILVACVRVSPTSNLLEGLFSYFLNLKNYSVFSFFDGGLLDVCENSNIKKNRFISKSLSVFEQYRFSHSFKTEPLFIRNSFDKKIQSIVEKCKNKSISELFQYKYQNISVGVHAKDGLCRYLLKETISQDEKNLLLDFIVTSLKTLFSFEYYCKLYSPKLVIVSHSLYSTWGVIADYCIQNNINIVAWGRGYAKNGGFLFSHNDFLHKSFIHEEIPLNFKLNIIQKDKIKKYFISKSTNQKDDIISYYELSDNECSLNEIKKISASFKKIIGVFPNIPWDGTTFSANNYVPNMRSFAKKIVDISHSYKQILFIIRVHPAEKKRKDNKTNESFLDFVKNYDIRNNFKIIESDSSISSYNLFQLIDASIVYHTTLALEMAVQKIPVLQLGNGNTSNKNCCYEVDNDQKLFYYINEILMNKLKISSTMYEDVLRYAYYWIYLKHKDDDLFNLNGFKFHSYKITSDEDILNSKLLNFMLQYSNIK
jgi:hypothetical protein